ncbi:uncharacterized protein [Rutidosis leptorrhynchoides]|uniref:uncharacterized protein n=1 Tax=Rutidosis leptorrhynchoides TaxID=125765 RepID=UPI003A98DF5E
MSTEDSSHDQSVNSTNQDLATQLSNLLKNNLQSHSKLSDSLKINLALNNQNYALWARMIKVALGGKSKSLLNHLTTVAPETSEEGYEQWEQDDLVVFSWLIQNIEPTLASNLTEYPTAKALWDALVVTYSSGKDKLQNFDLHVKANDIKQKDQSLEDLWITMQGIWGEIDRRDPNPMKCATDIVIYTKIRTEQKLFQFLNALDQNYDTIKRELLRLDPLPTPEEAYATVRKEVAHRHILGQAKNESSHQGIASGLVAANKSEQLGQTANPYPHRNKSYPKIDKSKLVCTKCGKKRHTREQCFEIKGFPEWWVKPAKGAAAVAEPPPTTTEPEIGFGGVAAKAEQGKFSKPFPSLFDDNNIDRTNLNLGQRNFIHKQYLGDRVVHDNDRCTEKIKNHHVNNLLNIRVKDKVVHKRYIGKSKNHHVNDLGNIRGSYKNLCSPTDKIAYCRKTDPRGNKGNGHVKSKLINKSNNGLKDKSLVNSKIKVPNRSHKTSNLHGPEPTIPCYNSYSALTKIKGDEVSQSEANVASKVFKTKSWVLDCGATDTMTFDKNDIIFKTKPKKGKIQTANGEIIQVESGGTIEISPTIKLPNCLYILALSHKLLSVSHVTKELNCKVLMYPTFCILQDIRTGLVIGRGTEKGGLYFIDEVSQDGTVLLSHGTPTREAWLWHRRLGHPSVGYLRFLFPSLFPSNVNLNCETCILAKSHRSTFKLSNTRKDAPFALIHSDVWGPAPINGGKTLDISLALLMIALG